MINIYFDIAVANAGEVSQMTSCGILLILEDKDDVKCRLFGFGLGWSDENLAKIQAARLALATIDPRCRKTPAVLHLADDTLLEWLRRTDDNEYSDAINKLVQLCELFGDLGFSPESPNDENITICRNLAEKISVSQQSYDSLTMDHIPDGQDQD